MDACVAFTGYVPGLCVSTSLQVNDTYLILASALDDVYRADRTIPAIWQEVYDIAGRGICGLQKVYPSGRCTEYNRQHCTQVFAHRVASVVAHFFRYFFGKKSPSLLCSDKYHVAKYLIYHSVIS